ncbi:MAG: S9 family peptidase [Acidobacteria bacterium]|nr:S9 family peptidase [Acidobacteriota bacterium]
MRRLIQQLAILLCLLGFASATYAQERMLTLDDLYDPAKSVNFNGNPPSGLHWTKDGSSYLQFKSDFNQLMKINAATGDAKPFYDAARMEAAFAQLAGLSLSDARALAHRPAYQMNAAETAVLLNTANDLFYYEFGSDKAYRLTNTPEVEEGEEFSPDGRMVSFARSNNLYVVDLSTQRERALTNDGNGKIFNGRLNWVYQEELYGRGNFKGYWWSPDSTRLVYLQINDTPVNEFTIVDHIPHFQAVETTPYPQAGDANPTIKLGVVKAAGGATTWVDIFKYGNVEPLIVRVGWTPDGKKVFYEIQNREQTWLDLNTADPLTGHSATLVNETSKTWVNVEKVEEPVWLKDGSFLLMSERSGWLHLYHYAADGKLLKQITAGKWDIRTLHGVDEANGYAYFSATQHSYIGLDTYRIKLDGTGLTRLTATDGTHLSRFNPTFTHFIDRWSDLNTPTQVRLHKADGAVVRSLDENRVAVLQQYKLSKPELLQVKTRDGFIMEALMIKPVNFDPAKKYPVMSFTYSGPQAPQVRNAWGGVTFMWYEMLAQKGYLIWVCDNRTASAKGAESVWPVYHNFGELELRDLEDGLNYLKSQPFVDASRIGLSGWSFGGFMTSYALTHSKSFKLGIAGGSVTDWRLYDTIYTERYMGTPQHNPEGYSKSSVLAAAKELSGKLLLVHGMIDDNVHMQNTIQLAYELQKADKPFQLMLYPKSRHGVADPLLVKHMRTMMTDFILQNL